RRRTFWDYVGDVTAPRLGSLVRRLRRISRRGRSTAWWWRGGWDEGVIRFAGRLPDVHDWHSRSRHYRCDRGEAWNTESVEHCVGIGGCLRCEGLQEDAGNPTRLQVRVDDQREFSSNIGPVHSATRRELADQHVLVGNEYGMGCLGL